MHNVLAMNTAGPFSGIVEKPPANLCHWGVKSCVEPFLTTVATLRHGCEKRFTTESCEQTDAFPSVLEMSQQRSEARGRGEDNS